MHIDSYQSLLGSLSLSPELSTPASASESARDSAGDGKKSKRQAKITTITAVTAHFIIAARIHVPFLSSH